jgi:hypothetical protein
MSDLIERIASDLIKRLEAVAEYGGTHLDGLWTEAATCIKELVAERAKWKAAAGSGPLADLSQEASASRDAIKAAEIERCAEAAEWFHNVERYDYRDIAKRIRALKPTEKK